MANISPTAGYDNVPILATTNRILGGDAGDPIGDQQLTEANRQAYRLLNNIEALKTGTAKGALNSVISGPEDFADFITGLSLTITGAVTPIVFNFANGVSSFGVNDTVVAYTGTSVTDFTGLPGEYLAFARYTGGAIVFEYLQIAAADIKYAITDTAPATIGATQYYFSPRQRKMFREAGGAWVADLAILVGGFTVAVGGTWYTRPYNTPTWSQNGAPGMINPIFTGSTTPPGWLRLDGTAGLKVVQYPELFLHVVDTGTPYTRTTPYNEFDLPDLTDSDIGDIGVAANWMVRIWY
jgi:hypothetical protein